MGRPKPDGGPDNEGKTTPTRVFTLDGELLYWIQQVTGKSSAAILRPIVRPDLTVTFEQLLGAAEGMAVVRGEKDRLDELKKKLGLGGESGQAPPPAEPAPPTPRPRRRPGGS